MADSNLEDHDQRCKELIEACFEEFMNWVRPDWGEHFRFDQAEWLRQEIFVDPPSGDRLIIDLVAKAPSVRPLAHPRLPRTFVDCALFHTEIEYSKSMIDFRPRVASYNIDLERRHDLPVFSQALLLKVGMDGLGIDEYVLHYFGEETRQSRWRYVGLPKLDGLNYIQGNNILAVALSPLMKIPKGSRPQACADALQKISEAPVSGQKRFLLGECVQAYAKLDAKRWEAFKASLSNPNQYAGADAMVSLIFKEGLKKGRIEGHKEGHKEGLMEGWHEMFLKVLIARFGPVDPEIERRVHSLSEKELDDLLPTALSAKTLDEVGLLKLKPHPHNGQTDANGKSES